ncbi:hypothetical protein C0989_004843 [Termitomyces sp. Mn162]|nr:hypothetical protein C0989_004843 [Termitomyces sp. Mn162]
MAARRILWGKCVNAGQTCVAPDYVLVPRSFQDKFVAALEAAYKSFYPESAQPSDPDTFSRIVTHQAWKRIKGLIDTTKGTVVVGGEMDEATKFIAPTIVRDVKADDSLMSEEIFGPVLPLVPVEDVDEAIAFVNARDHPLALYVFSQDAEFKAKVFTNTLSGSAVANETLLHLAVDGMPFGGVGPSGYGAHTGKFGFDTFTHLRASLDSPSWVDKIIGFRFPPYDKYKLNMAYKLFPSLPARPIGAPSVIAKYKWWGKWFFFAFASGNCLGKLMISSQFVALSFEELRDNFTGGNPAAVVFTDLNQSEEIFKNIAQNFNQPITAFVSYQPLTPSADRPSKAVAFSVRWYTASRTEVPLCGHGTLAAAKGIFERADVAQDTEIVELHTFAHGVVTATQRLKIEHIATGGKGFECYAIFVLDEQEVLKNFSVNPTSLHPVWSPLEYYQATKIMYAGPLTV